MPNIEIVTQQVYGAADTDFTGQLIAVRDAKPQVVVNCGLFPAAKILLRQANELGIEAVWLGDAGQANATVWAEAGAGAEDWLFNWYQPQYLTDTTGPMAEFRAKSLAAYPDAPEGGTKNQVIPPEMPSTCQKKLHTVTVLTGGDYPINKQAKPGARQARQPLLQRA